MTPTIAIIGAGPGGLTLGRLLEVNDFDYVVFERSGPSDVLEPSIAVDLISDSGQLALEEGGLLDKFKKVANYDEQLNVGLDQHGDMLMKSTDENKARVDRKDLRELLHKSIPAGRIQWDCEVEQVQRDADGSMSIRFIDGSIQKGFKLVVGADGAWSKARHLVTSAKPQYSGLHYMQTSISLKTDFSSTVVGQLRPANIMAIAHGKQIAAQLSRQGVYTVWAALPLPENWSDPGLSNGEAFARKLLEHDFSTWATKNKNWLKYSDSDFRAWPLYSMPAHSLSWQSVPGIALLGDAAHVTIPIVGEGVDCAMRDSLELAQEIVKHGIDGLDKAVSDYEKSMFPRAIELITRTLELRSLYFAKDAPKSIQDMISAMAEQQRISNDSM